MIEETQLDRLTDWQAAGLGRYSFKPLRKLNASTIHLFMVVPRGLAALSGYWWNTPGPFQCYEYLLDKKTYVPTWRIGG